MKRARWDLGKQICHTIKHVHLKRLNNHLGKVRPERVKKVARELIKRYPNKFSTDFESNKKTLTSLATVRSLKLKNQIAGYITRLAAISKAAGEEEAGEAEEGEETE